MTRHELNDKYFSWMYQLVCNDRHYTKSYEKLLSCLHDIEFIYTIGRDGNRYEDGVELRYRFGYENSYEYSMIAAFLDDRPCSVLEMMVALAIRCEEDIMGDPDFGDRTEEWFWDMITNLGLDDMDDDIFDEQKVRQVVSHMLNHQYRRNGEGGLFRIDNCEYDLRTIEIWYQLNWYLNSLYKN